MLKPIQTLGADHMYMIHDLQGPSAYLVWRSEHKAVILLWLQQAPQSLEFVDLGEHSLPGQQHVEVAALIQHLADSSDGAVQLGQTLVQFLHLQVQRLGLQLTDLLHLEGDRTREQNVFHQQTGNYCSKQHRKHMTEASINI